MTRGRPGGVLAALGAALAAMVLAPAAADAAKVANPGNFTAPVSNGFLRVKSDTFSFDSSTPITLSGNLNAAGQISNGNVSFPNLPVSAGGFDLTVKIQPASSNPVSGTINPITGEGSIRLRVWIKIDGVPLGGGCRIASASSPIDVNALITGSTGPTPPNPSISGTPYNPANGTLKIVNNNFSVPSSSDCGIAGGTVNDTLGLPSGSGNNEAQFTLDTNPNFQPGVTASFTATPANGFAPHQVTFNASASTHSAAVQNYRWDFDGNGTFDQTTTSPTVTHTYTSGGTYQPKMRITDVDGDFAETTRTVTVTNRPDLSVTSSHSDPFRFGTPGTYTLNVINDGSGPTTGPVTVTDTLPDGLTYQSATGTGWTCGHAGQVVTCTRASLAANTTAPPITLNVGVGAAAVGQVTNSVSVETANELNLANNSHTDPTNVRAVDLTIEKSHDSEHFRLGAHANNTYEILVTNNGTAATFAPTTVTDTLPEGLTYVDATGSGWSCSAAGQDVTCTHAGPIAANSDAAPIELQTSAALDPDEPARTVTNTATVATADDLTPSDNSAEDKTLILNAPDLDLVKTHAGNFVAGAQAEYELEVRNRGPVGTDDTTTVTDTLPNGLTFVSAMGTGWSCGAAGQEVTCEHDDPIAADSSAEKITLTVAVGQAAIPEVTNTASVANEDDPNPGNDSASDPTLVRAIDLDISKEADGVFRIGREATYEFEVENEGDSATVAPAVIVDTLPDGLTYAGFTGSGWNCNDAGQTITCSYAPAIADGASADTLRMQVDVDASAAPEVTNTATVSTVDDFNPDNDSDAEVTPIVGQDAGIAISRTGGFSTGATGTYLIAVDNVGTVATSGDTEVTVRLPAGLQFVSASGNGWDCAEAGGEVTCTRDDSIAPETPVPDISLRVLVTPAAAPSVTTQATVSTPDDRNPANDTASDTATVTGPDVGVDSSHPGSFRVGGSGSYTLEVTNEGDGPTTAATVVTDTLPSGLSYLEATGAGWECDQTATQEVTCTRTAEIASQETAPPITLDVKVGPAAAPSVTNEVAVTTAADKSTANDTDSDPTQVTMVDLTLDLDDQGDFAVGGQADYVATVRNVGDAASVGIIRVNDTLPTGLVPVEAGGDGWSCTISGQDVSCTRAGALAPNEEAPELAMKADINASAVDNVSNTATVMTADDGNPANDSATVLTSVSRNPDLALELAAHPAAGFIVGSDASYKFAVRNVGGEATSGPTTLSATLGDGLALRGSGNAEWSCSAVGTDVTCTHADPIAPGERSDLELEVDVLPAAGDSVDTTAALNAAGDINPANDEAAATSAITRVDLRLQRSHSGDWQEGQQATYELTVDNVGTAPTFAPVVVTERLPQGTTFASAGGSGWDCTATADKVICTYAAPIAPGGAAAPISIVVDVGDGAAPETTGEAVVETVADANPANNAAGETIEVALPPVHNPRGLPAEILTRKTRPTSTGLVRVFVRCPTESELRCQGELSLESSRRIKQGKKRKRLTLGSALFDAAKGRLDPATVKLTKRQRKLLRKLGKLKLTATATTYGFEPKTRKITLISRTR